MNTKQTIEAKDISEDWAQGETIEWVDDYDNAPESNLYTRIDDIIWDNCKECRLIRFGLFAGSIITNVITWVALSVI